MLNVTQSSLLYMYFYCTESRWYFPIIFPMWALNNKYISHEQVQVTSKLQELQTRSEVEEWGLQDSSLAEHIQLWNRGVKTSSGSTSGKKLAVWPWANLLTSTWPNLLMCKMTGRGRIRLFLRSLPVLRYLF